MPSTWPEPPGKCLWVLAPSWAAHGWSQGGGAAAAVAELDAADYGELQLVGTVPMSPGVASIAYGMPKGLTAALGNPSIPPEGHLLMVLAGFQIANPDVLKLSDYFTPLGIEIIETSWNIQPVHQFRRHSCSPVPSQRGDYAKQSEKPRSLAGRSSRLARQPRTNR